MNLGMRMLRIAVLYLFAGLVIGLGMGISGNFALTSVHAHALLLGWVTMGLAALVYLHFPRCAESKMARAHFWGSNAALPAMMIGLGFEVYGAGWTKPVIAASSVLMLSALGLFALNLVLNGGKSARE